MVGVNIDFKGIEILSTPKLSINSVTNAKATRYPFLERHRHYMGAKQIGTYNRIAVEACVFVKFSTAIKDLETMKIPVMEEFFTTNTRVSCAQFLTNVLLTMICAQVCWRSMGVQKSLTLDAVCCVSIRVMLERFVNLLFTSQESNPCQNFPAEQRSYHR